MQDAAAFANAAAEDAARAAEQASVDAMRAAQDAEPVSDRARIWAGCLASAAADFDDRVSDASTIAEASLSDCRRLFNDWRILAPVHLYGSPEERASQQALLIVLERRRRN